MPGRACRICCLFLPLLILKAPAVEPDAEIHARAFDALWAEMDRHYSYFEIKKIDWNQFKARYRPKAIAARDVNEFVAVVKEMLAAMKDGHVWLQVGQETIYPHVYPPRVTNGNAKATFAALDSITRCGDFAAVGRTKLDGFGAFIVMRQSRADQANVLQAVQLIETFKDAPGFILDLRGANGGNENLAMEIAKQFCDKPTAYAKRKYRSGPGHGEFGPAFPTVLLRADQPFVKPVVCVIGPGCVSSGEGFALMLRALPQVTMVGVATRGASGNPKPFKLPELDISVFYSRWVAMDAKGTPIEDVGIAPDIEVDLPAAAYKDNDPTWTRAIEVLREKTRR